MPYFLLQNLKKWLSAVVEFFSRRRLLSQAAHSFSLQLIALLFVKLPRPGDSKGIFSASSLKLSLVYQ